MSETPRIPSLRDLRIILEDGTEKELPEGSITEVQPGKQAEEPRRLGPWVGSVTFQAEINPAAVAWLRYWTRVRPWLHCPLEYRLN